MSGMRAKDEWQPHVKMGDSVHEGGRQHQAVARVKTGRNIGQLATAYMASGGRLPPTGVR